jgi:hypothetical protein
MDYILIGSGVALAAFGFIFGRLSVLPRLIDTQTELDRLYRDYSRITTRDDRGRFTKKDAE